MPIDDTAILEVTRLAFVGEQSIPVKEVAIWIDPDVADMDSGDERLRILPEDIDPDSPRKRFLLSVTGSLVDSPSDLEPAESDWWSLYDRDLSDGVVLVSQGAYDDRVSAIEIEASQQQAAATNELAAAKDARNAALTKIAESSGLTADEIAALVGD